MCETDEPQGRPEGPGEKRKGHPPSRIDSQDKDTIIKGKRMQERSTFAKTLADETLSGRGGQPSWSRTVWSPGPCSAEEPHQQEETLHPAETGPAGA